MVLKGFVRPTLTQKNGRFYYAILQIVYWMISGLTFSFASAYLLNVGVSNSRIGIVIGGAYAFSTLIQPLYAAFLRRVKCHVHQGIMWAYLLMSGLCIPLFSRNVSILLRMGLLIVIYGIESAMQPFMTALVNLYETASIQIDFGKARSMASLVYTGFMALMGVILEWLSPGVLPVLYFLASMMMVILLAVVRLPNKLIPETVSPQKSIISARINSQIVFFMLGRVFISLGSMIAGCYLLQIMQNVGGGVSDVGLFDGIGAALEVPVLFFYSRLSEKFNCRKLLVLSGWFYVVKYTIILLAKNPLTICLAQLTQIFGFGLYLPSSIEYVSELYSLNEYLHGQAVAGSASTIGCIISAVAGGMLLDTIGIANTQEMSVFILAIGAVLVTISVIIQKRAILLR